MRRAAIAMLAGAVLLASGCRRDVADADARKIVQTYLDRVIDAYRTADFQVASPVVTAREEKKLAGLIGVKADSGIALDAQLLEIQFGRIERIPGAVMVYSRERWHYRDRRIGTGEQVGDESTDLYELRYRLVLDGGKWLVDEVEFTKDPIVGRKVAPVTAPAKVMHGVQSPEAVAGQPSGAAAHAKVEERKK